MRGRSSNTPQQLYPFYSAQQVIYFKRSRWAWGEPKPDLAKYGGSLGQCGTRGDRLLLLHRPEYIRSRLAGNNYFGLPKLGERYTKALRAAAGKIDDPTAGLAE
jgi:hypothetical protein